MCFAFGTTGAKHQMLIDAAKSVLPPRVLVTRRNCRLGTSVGAACGSHGTELAGCAERTLRQQATAVAGATPQQLSTGRRGSGDGTLGSQVGAQTARTSGRGPGPVDFVKNECRLTYVSTKRKLCNKALQHCLGLMHAGRSIRQHLTQVGPDLI